MPRRSKRPGLYGNVCSRGVGGCVCASCGLLPGVTSRRLAPSLGRDLPAVCLASGALGGLRALGRGEVLPPSDPGVVGRWAAASRDLALPSASSVRKSAFVRSWGSPLRGGTGRLAGGAALPQREGDPARTTGKGFPDSGRRDFCHRRPCTRCRVLAVEIISRVRDRASACVRVSRCDVYNSKNPQKFLYFNTWFFLNPVLICGVLLYV